MSSSTPKSVSISMELVFPSTAAKVITLIQLIYGIPSFLLMILFFFFLGCSKNYSNSFYRLVQLDLLTNILCYFNTWIGMRIEKHPSGVLFLKSLESLIPGLIGISKIGLNFFMHMQFCSSAALSIHRITSTVFFSKYEKFWSRFYLLYGLLAAFYSLLPDLFISERSVEVSVINDTLTVTYHLDALSQAVFQTAVLSVIYFILLLVIGLTTAVMVSRVIKTYNNDDRGVSKKLTKIALTYGSVYTGILLWSVITALNNYLWFLPDIILVINSDLLMFSSDMMTLALPYVLLIFDSNVRRDMLQMFSRRRTDGTTNIFVSSSSTNK